jgi:U2-associated protein SR140
MKLTDDLKINEASLCRDFAIFGPIASVKIMWPRSQEEKERNRNSAFISFMKRSDAEKALKAMDGKDLHGHLLRVCWGKAVPLPAQPIFGKCISTYYFQTSYPC